MSLQLTSSGFPRWPLIAAAFLTIAGVALWQMPARWLQSSISQKTHCKVVLSDPSGSIWHGNAAIGFSEPTLDGKACRSPLALTERINWDAHCSLFSFSCRLTVDTPALNKPLQVVITPGTVIVRENEVRLPAEILEVAGAPWTLLHPRAQLNARWTDLDFGDKASGSIRASLNDLVSPISQIKPLGSYDIQAELSSTGLNYTLASSKGPLLLKAEGSFGPSGANGQGEATATPDMLEALTGLLNLIGKKQGDIYRLSF